MMHNITTKVDGIVRGASLPDGPPCDILKAVKSQVIEPPGYLVVDGTKPDGITMKPKPFDNALYAPDGDLGEVFVFERDTGATRLFFVWLSPYLKRVIKDNNVGGQFSFHILFHPPTYENCYKNTAYWDGACTDWRGEGCDPTMQGKPLYLKLGLRYLSTDFRAIAQHFVAGSGSLTPNLLYVVPVADGKNFSDIVQPSTLVTVLGEVLEGVVSAVRGYAVSMLASAAVGKVIISAYSRSGTRLEALFSYLNSEKSFFKDHLDQVNAFDIVLGEKSDEKLFNLWLAMFQWRRLYTNASIVIYTAYSTPARRMILEAPGVSVLNTRLDVNFETASWTDPKPPTGPSRGSGFEALSNDRRVHVTLLPISFFNLYIINQSGPVENPRGFDHKKTGHFHGHGMFLRTMMSHALSIASAEPSFFTKRSASP